MRNHLLAVMAAAALSVAAPAFSQVVNGANKEASGVAPIGTKAPGTPSSIQTEQQAANLAAAHKNQRDWKHGNMGARDKDRDRNSHY